MVHSTYPHPSSVHTSPVHGLRAIMDLGVSSITFTSGASNGFFSIGFLLTPIGYNLQSYHYYFILT